MRGYIKAAFLPWERAVPTAIDGSVTSIGFLDDDTFHFAVHVGDGGIVGAKAAIPAVQIDNGEIVSQIKEIDADDSLFKWLIGARIAPDSLNGYWGGVYQSGGSINYDMYVNLYVNLTAIGGITKTILRPINIRFRLDGTSLSLKAWYSGDIEPTSWDVSGTDSTYSSGMLGIDYYSGYRYSSAADCYLKTSGIGFALGEFDAPFSGGLATISGQVTLGGTPISGATVIAVRQGYDFSKPGIPGIDFAKAITDDNGNYTISLDCDTGPYHVFAFYDDGTYKYTDQTKVFIEV